MYVVGCGYFFRRKNAASVCYYTFLSLDAVIGYFIGSIPIRGYILRIAAMAQHTNTNFSGFHLRLSVLHSYFSYHKILALQLESSDAA